MEEEIRVAEESALLTKEYVQKLAKRLKALGRSRQGTATWLSDVVFGWDGVARFPNGQAFELYDEVVDDAYGNDQAFSWNSEVKRFAERPPLRRPRRVLLLRLRLFDLAFKIVSEPIL